MAGRQARICLGCWQQMRLPVSLRGIASAPFRAVGIKPSRMNPNTCTICELMFTRVMKARQVVMDATILFADLRGYTGLSQDHDAGTVTTMTQAPSRRFSTPFTTNARRRSGSTTDCSTRRWATPS